MVFPLFMKNNGILLKDKIAAIDTFPSAISHKFMISAQSPKISVTTRCACLYWWAWPSVPTSVIQWNLPTETRAVLQAHNFYLDHFL